MTRLDNHKLVKISKKYSKQGIRTWSTPNKKQIELIESMLIINKNKTLQSLKLNTKDWNRANLIISRFIRSFIDKELFKLKFPKISSNFKNSNDDLNNVLDFEYLNKFQKKIVTIYSKDLKILQNLQQSFDDESNNLKDLEKFYQNFLKTYNDELNKILIDNPDLTESNLINNQSIDSNIDTIDNNDLDKELEIQLQKLNDGLIKINSKTVKLNQFAKLLNEF
ncbi:hypothetical protein WICMUC_001380 [Wickerhamomyces mucosus]|uniref:Uncharacterized protein n=1 Tax=Wickerhamomyces mucosus TaxID=1378264 RepID=A0A9P8TH17_9ASCO|nr:hypothetical protein WICMUC_001380 [Wickerhamomyces mucosus]